ncbi:hypothetical protein CG006_03275 [Mesoplasma florum]|uniref:hypothetical protein n=1 Tax=Mesoplasma florum TaxID=2151 RepID=UPI000D028BDA|nr:hypothetical protein [Mesoplasma florum]AVN63972.1 hypothetical protein CG006_03275 [Mesoplasma florum]
MKFFKILLASIILCSGLVTLFFAITSANFFGNKIVDNLSIKKVTFKDNEWRSFINRDGDIDKDKFISVFLLKLENQAYVENISFDFELNKVEVNIWNNYKNYKWFYQLEKA